MLSFDLKENFNKTQRAGQPQLVPSGRQHSAELLSENVISVSVLPQRPAEDFDSEDKHGKKSLSVVNIALPSIRLHIGSMFALSLKFDFILSELLILLRFSVLRQVAS